MSMGTTNDLKCLLCGVEEESIGHLFFHCEFSYFVLSSAASQLKQLHVWPKEWNEWTNLITNS